MQMSIELFHKKAAREHGSAVSFSDPPGYPKDCLLNDIIKLLVQMQEMRAYFKLRVEEMKGKICCYGRYSALLIIRARQSEPISYSVDSKFTKVYMTLTYRFATRRQTVYSNLNELEVK